MQLIFINYILNIHFFVFWSFASLSTVKSLSSNAGHSGLPNVTDHRTCDVFIFAGWRRSNK